MSTPDSLLGWEYNPTAADGDDEDQTFEVEVDDGDVLMVLNPIESSYWPPNSAELHGKSSCKTLIERCRQDQKFFVPSKEPSQFLALAGQCTRCCSLGLRVAAQYFAAFFLRPSRQSKIVRESIQTSFVNYNGITDGRAPLPGG